MAWNRRTFTRFVVALVVGLFLFLGLLGGAVVLLAWSEREHCREHPVECTE